MWWIILIAALIIFGVLFLLYTIGKRVKESEMEFVKMFDEQTVKRKLSKYKRKSTPKVPTKKYINGKNAN